MHRLTATDTPMVRYTRTIFPSYAQKHLMTTIQMNCYYYPILLNNHALKFYSILILSADSPIFNNFLDIPLLFLEFLIQDHL